MEGRVGWSAGLCRRDGELGCEERKMMLILDVRCEM